MTTRIIIDHNWGSQTVNVEIETETASGNYMNLNINMNIADAQKLVSDLSDNVAKCLANQHREPNCN